MISGIYNLIDGSMTQQLRFETIANNMANSNTNGFKKDIISFSAFVSFFPQLVAGPIERATLLLPQILAKRKFNYDQAMQGIYQILWGLIKKMVIADNAAEIVDLIFSNNSFSF